MTKAELVDAMAVAANLSKKDVETAFDAMIDTIVKALRSGDKVNITGFGVFSVSDRAAREGINPQTKEKIQIAATKVPKFKAGKTLKDMIKAA